MIIFNYIELFMNRRYLYGFMLYFILYLVKKYLTNLFGLFPKKS